MPPVIRGCTHGNKPQTRFKIIQTDERGFVNIDPKLAEVIKGIIDSLTDEQREKAKTCKNMDELMEFAGVKGVELPGEVLDMVSGGCGDGEYIVPDKPSLYNYCGRLLPGEQVLVCPAL